MKKIKDIANNLIDTYKTNNPFEICKSMNIKINYTNLGSLKGFTTENFKVFSISLNSDLEEYQKEFVCWHELGHILLEHNHNQVFLSTKTFINVDKYENQADMFATHMIFKKYKKEELQNLTIEQISNMTGVNKIHISMYFNL